MEAGLDDICINVNIPFRDSWVLLPNMSSEAFIGAVSLASIVSTFPVDKYCEFFYFLFQGYKLFGHKPQACVSPVPFC